MKAAPPNACRAGAEFCHLCGEDQAVPRYGHNGATGRVQRVGVVGVIGVGAMRQGGAAYAMAIESAALAMAACDLRLQPQLNEAFSEALELRGGLIKGNICIASDAIAVLDDIFARVIALYSEDLVPVREHVLRERAENLLRRVLGEVGADNVLRWPFGAPESERRG